MDAKERVELIRQGNQAFNKGDYNTAQKLFVQANYQDGLIRIGDYWFYEKRKPLMALGFYKRAGEKNKVREIMQRMIYALKRWVSSSPENSPGSPEIKKEERKDDGAGPEKKESDKAAVAPVADSIKAEPVKPQPVRADGTPVIDDGPGKIFRGRRRKDTFTIPQVAKEKDPLYQAALRILAQEKK